MAGDAHPFIIPLLGASVCVWIALLASRHRGHAFARRTHICNFVWLPGHGCLRGRGNRLVRGQIVRHTRAKLIRTAALAIRKASTTYASIAKSFLNNASCARIASLEWLPSAQSLRLRVSRLIHKCCSPGLAHSAPSPELHRVGKAF
jgi:hypothetical protein